jgi:hypothetical protein
MVNAALAGEASYHEDLPLVIRRRGFDEPACFTFSYSPVRDERGAVAGMYCVVAETTGKVLTDRRRSPSNRPDTRRCPSHRSSRSDRMAMTAGLNRIPTLPGGAMWTDGRLPVCSSPEID